MAVPERRSSMSLCRMIARKTQCNFRLNRKVVHFKHCWDDVSSTLDTICGSKRKPAPPPKPPKPRPASCPPPCFPCCPFCPPPKPPGPEPPKPQPPGPQPCPPQRPPGPKPPGPPASRPRPMRGPFFPPLPPFRF